VKADAAGRQTLQGSLTPSAKPVASTRSRATAAPCLQRLAECPGKIVQKSTKPTQLGFTAFPARAPVTKKIGTVRHSPPRSEWPPPKAASASGTCSEKIAAHNEARGNARAHTVAHQISFLVEESKHRRIQEYKHIYEHTYTHTHSLSLSLGRGSRLPTYIHRNSLQTSSGHDSPTKTPPQAGHSRVLSTRPCRQGAMKNVGPAKHLRKYAT
jgi:hypothetical protein